MWAENPQATPAERDWPRCHCGKPAGLNSWGNAIAVWGFTVCHACSARWLFEAERRKLFAAEKLKALAVELFANARQIAGKAPALNEGEARHG